MTSRWADRFFGRPPRADRMQPDQQQLALTEALLHLDNRQSAVELAVQASEAFAPQKGLRWEWMAIADQCYQASGAYLAATESTTGSRSPNTPSPTSATVLNQLHAATRAVDDFYTRYQSHLEQTTAAMTEVPGRAEDAVAVANVVRHQLATEAAQFAHYPSIADAADALNQAMTTLDAALAEGRPRSISDTTEQVQSATTTLRDALAAAPSTHQRATHALTAVRTRLAAVQTRSERITPTLSVLLREFSLASSSDLTDNERASQRIINDAATTLDDAEAALRADDPERSLELTTAARSALTEAETLVDTVTDRLQLLRQVQRDPDAPAAAVRFTLRDARMLAASRGQLRQWRTILDAQAEHVDRICAQLRSSKPDYFAYLTELDTVSSSVKDVIERMREHAHRPTS